MSGLSDFLAEYAHSYETYEASNVASFIHCPCVFFLRNDCVLLDTPGSVISFMQTALAAYRANGCAVFKATLLQERLIGPRFALIDVEWTPEDKEGVARMHFFTTYNLVRDEERWMVSMITRHDA